MTASVTDFITNGIRNGGQRPNRYRIIFAFPSGVASGSVANTASYLAKSASIPGLTAGPAETPYMGRTVKLAGDLTINDWSTTITIDSMEVYHAFNAWLNAGIGVTSNRGRVTPREYMADITLHLLDRDDKVVSKMQLISCFVTALGDVSLAYDANNTLMELPVTFAINDLKNESTR